MEFDTITGAADGIVRAIPSLTDSFVFFLSCRANS